MVTGYNYQFKVAQYPPPAKIVLHLQGGLFSTRYTRGIFVPQIQQKSKFLTKNKHFFVGQRYWVVGQQTEKRLCNQEIKAYQVSIINQQLPHITIWSMEGGSSPQTSCAKSRQIFALVGRQINFDLKPSPLKLDPLGEDESKFIMIGGSDLSDKKSL